MSGYIDRLLEDRANQIKRLTAALELADTLALLVECQLEAYPEMYDGPLHKGWLAYQFARKEPEGKEK